MRVETGESDVVWFVGALREVKPGAYFSLFYSRRPNDFWSTRLGPTYCWRGDGTLTERYWKDADAVCDYLYYKTGQLFRYNGQGLEEIFARDGSLIACHYGGVYYWLGNETSRSDYQRLESEFQGRALK